VSAFDAEALDVAPGTFIPLSEIEIRAISGGGPGGQHVNKSATRVAITWNVRTSRALRDDQRTRLLGKLASRLDQDGAMRIVAGEFRSQQQNRRAALERLQQLVQRALVVPRTRKPTKPTRGSVERRLDEKRRRSETKSERRRFTHE
jgi:ribosome-associated protein